MSGIRIADANNRMKEGEQSMVSYQPKNADTASMLAEAATAATNEHTLPEGAMHDEPGDQRLVLPEGVALMLDRAMQGLRASGERTEGEPQQCTNLAVMVGQITATRRRRDQRHVTTRSPQGTPIYAYHLTVNEVVGDELAARVVHYRFPIGMSESIHAQYSDLLVDGQRVILMGPLQFERKYDPGMRQTSDPLDPGMPVWNVRIDVLSIEEAPEQLPDSGTVVFAGEVVRAPRCTRRLSGPGGATDIYAEVLLRDRRMLPSASGVPRPVVTTLPVEVLVDPEMELIPGSDALLVVGSRVRIAGHIGMRILRRNPRRNPMIGNVLERVATDMRQRNDAAQSRLAAYRAEMADVPRGQRTGYSGPTPLDAAVLERRIAFAQRNVIEQELVHIEVGTVTVLQAKANLDDAQRSRLIADGLERGRRRNTAPHATETRRRASGEERQEALDAATTVAMTTTPHRDTDQPAEHADPAPSVRPRRRMAPQTSMPVQADTLDNAGDGIGERHEPVGDAPNSDAVIGEGDVDGTA